ncbi:C69 family dipeptidase [Porphyromonas cangingivalis]|uniref:Dipeptidase n=1 Tax=Porphyromonas cangingivalis TaxID=36874 RepID=A0A0A2EJZ2_PORCN|nr:C69 family dipeptidase [Porphyromonas cangingivalis]KGN79258.1 peptidase C69 [Porphyromonas cangingivalis]SJZ79136.1 Dipeptidase [Porphyromonas cangingivalis]SPY35176.1 Dipeptidase A [Porphyromonas cangingivalis]VEJ03575.1 Dipeptidase A [Porphyromonas cangingivalis]
MKRLFLSAFLLVMGLSFSQDAKACTDLIVGRKASTDGSVIVSYAADSHTLYGALYHWPAAVWQQGAMLKVYEWDTGVYGGDIAQVGRTYNVVGNMNEKQVAITESTFGGREDLHGTEGIMDYGSLIYIALQRSATAREAIKVMTGLVDKYGYKSTGESFTIADKNEVWVMEMIGKGKGEKGAVWVAIRIPDDCISAHANQARIQQIPFNDKENCMYSKDVVEFARKKGFYKGKDKDFSFQQVYAPYDFGALRGCEARVWSFFNRFADGMDKYLPLITGHNPQNDPMPLYVKPNRKLSVADVRDMMRDHYEGTALDMTQDIGAGPYACPYRWRPMTFKVDGQEYVNERAIATQQSGFVLVAQLRNYLPDYVGGVLWFAVDDADMAVFTPMYGSITRVPECYSEQNGDLLTFSWTSAFWMHNWVANMAYNKYSYMIKDIRKVQGELESKFMTMQPMIEQYAMELGKKDEKAAIDFLTNYSCSEAEMSTARWKELGTYLLVKYIDGNIKKEKDGKFERSEVGMPVSPKQPGYDEQYYRRIAEQTGDRLKVKK